MLPLLVLTAMLTVMDGADADGGARVPRLLLAAATGAAAAVGKAVVVVIRNR